jgi:hypothetical protein
LPAVAPAIAPAIPKSASAWAWDMAQPTKTLPIASAQACEASANAAMALAAAAAFNASALLAFRKPTYWLKTMSRRDVIAQRLPRQSASVIEPSE